MYGMEKVMINIKEFAEKANLSEDHVRALLREGKVKGIKVGREWRISCKEVEKFLGINDSSQIVKMDRYIKELESKVERYEGKMCALTNVINSMTEIVKIN